MPWADDFSMVEVILPLAMMVYGEMEKMDVDPGIELKIWGRVHELYGIWGTVWGGFRRTELRRVISLNRLEDTG
jgi:hypothetical protein